MARAVRDIVFPESYRLGPEKRVKSPSQDRLRSPNTANVGQRDCCAPTTASVLPLFLVRRYPVAEMRFQRSPRGGAAHIMSTRRPLGSRPCSCRQQASLWLNQR